MPKIKKRGNAAKHQQPEEELRSIARQVSGFAAEHKKNLTIVAAVIVVALVLFAGYRFMRTQQEQKAAPALAAAMGFYLPPQGAAGPDYAKALDLFRAAQKQYPSTLNGAIAQYYVGNCLANLERYDEALKEYQAFTGKYPGDTLLLGLVYERMGYVYGNLGRQTDAVKAFEQSEKLNGPGASTLELAKLYESTGNAAGAQEKYKVIADKLAGTTWAMEAMGKVQKIVPMPAPAAPKESK